MKLKALVAALAFSAAAPSFAATCTETFDLGPLGPPGAALIYNSFTSVSSFSDCYNFSLASTADSAGLTLEWDWSWKRDVNVQSVSIAGASGTMIDATEIWGVNTFSFSDLAAGAYQLIVAGNVTGANGGLLGGGEVGYGGYIQTTRAVTAPVPEPETYAMMAIGLAGIGFASRRRKNQAQRAA